MTMTEAQTRLFNDLNNNLIQVMTRHPDCTGGDFLALLISTTLAFAQLNGSLDIADTVWVQMMEKVSASNRLSSAK